MDLDKVCIALMAIALIAMFICWCVDTKNIDNTRKRLTQTWKELEEYEGINGELLLSQERLRGLLDASRVGKAKAEADCYELRKEVANLRYLLRQACAIADQISDIRLQLNPHSPQVPANGPYAGPVKGTPPDSAGPVGCQNPAGNCCTSGNSPLQSINAPSKRYEDVLKTDRTA